MSYANLLAYGWQPQPLDYQYNVTASSMAKIRQALAESNNGKLVPFGIIGDSAASGYNVTGAESPDLAWPGILRTQLNANGFPSAGSVVVTADYTHAPQWSYGAGWTYGGSFYYSTANGAQATYVSEDAGVSVTVYYSGLSGAFSFTVDGGAPNNVVPGGTSALGSTTVAGLANTTHTIVVTAGAAACYLVAAQVNNASGLLWANMALAGSGVTVGTGNVLGTPGTWASFATGSCGFIRQQSILNGFTGGSYGTPIIGIALGGNDFNQNVLVPAVANGFQFLISESPNAAFFIVHNARTSIFTDATDNAWYTALQTIAQNNNLPLFDWSGRYGGYSGMLNAGLLQSDNTHPSKALSASFGEAMGAKLVA